MPIPHALERGDANDMVLYPTIDNAANGSFDLIVLGRDSAARASGEFFRVRLCAQIVGRTGQQLAGFSFRYQDDEALLDSAVSALRDR